jgi:hypothetical protein
MSHWIVSQAVYSEVQVGRGAAAGTRHLDRLVARALEINRSVPSTDRDMELRDAIQRIALEWPCYRRPRITEELRRRWTVSG